MILRKNAKILTMAERDLEKGDILMGDGKIQRIGENIAAPAGAEIIDASGLTAMPGIVDAHCHIGMWEDSIDEEGADGNECTDPVTPELRAIDAINPVDRCFQEAREGGVTTVVTGPGSANVIGGQFAALKTYGACVDEMVIKAPAALKMALGENPKGVYGGEQKKAPMTRMASAALIREALVEAQEYAKEMESDDPPKRDLKNEILCQALRGELLVKIHAHRADDIFTAIRLAKEFNLRLSLEHCTDGYLIAPYVKESGAKVIIGPLLCDRCKPELKNLSWNAPRVLYENGVEFAMMSDHPVQPTQLLQVTAAMAVKYGLPGREALKAITINAAKAVCLEDRIGSLEEGKDADIVLYSGDPLDVRSNIAHVFIDGKQVR